MIAENTVKTNGNRCGVDDSYGQVSRAVSERSMEHTTIGARSKEAAIRQNLAYRRVTRKHYALHFGIHNQAVLVVA